MHVISIMPPHWETMMHSLALYIGCPVTIFTSFVPKKTSGAGVDHSIGIVIVTQDVFAAVCRVSKISMLSSAGKRACIEMKC